ncbi:hypothetical protein HMI54_000442 [Coelomomyces lativittatus]|nr:hypothetical protein HMI54_000442 [Coelomomyces lativittatus]
MKEKTHFVPTTLSTTTTPLLIPSASTSSPSFNMQQTPHQDVDAVLSTTPTPTPTPWHYQPKSQHPLFTTSANDYGFFIPTPMELPKKRFTVTRKFTEHLNRAGPYKNYSLNIK